MSSEALLTARKSGIEPPTVTPTASAATKSRHQHEDRQPRRLVGDVKIGQPQGMEQKWHAENSVLMCRKDNFFTKKDDMEFNTCLGRTLVKFA